MRTKRALYNFLTDFFPLILITLIGLLKLKLINVNLGEELSGMNTLYVNIIILSCLIQHCFIVYKSRHSPTPQKL